MIPNRIKRVNTLLKQEISRLLMLEINDPRVKFVSVIDVVTAKDLHTARVYVSVLGSEVKQKEALEGLKRASHFIRTRLQDELELRFTPKLLFYLDHSIERGVRVSMLINEIAAEIVEVEVEGEKKEEKEEEKEEKE